VLSGWEDEDDPDVPDHEEEGSVVETSEVEPVVEPSVLDTDAEDESPELENGAPFDDPRAIRAPRLRNVRALRTPAATRDRAAACRRLLRPAGGLVTLRLVDVSGESGMRVSFDRRSVVGCSLPKRPQRTLDSD
jgi:hypothetical protein